VAGPIKYGGMSLEEIAQAEGSTVAAINMLLSRALRKLRKQKLICTAAELARQLDANRNDAHIVRTGRGKR